MSAMIQDARALRQMFVPAELRHREGDVDAVSSHLRPIENGLAGDDVLLTGPSGTGKSTLARFVTQELEQATLDVRTGCVTCTSDSSKTEALYALVRDLGIGKPIPRTSASTSLLLDRIREADDQLVLVVDEVDQLADRSILATLYEIPHVTMLMVCIDGDVLLADAEPRVQSRLWTAASVTLEPYSRGQLADIVMARANAGLHAGTFSQASADKIGDLAAGDAHYAIALLRRAAREATTEGVDRITPSLIEEVTGDAYRERREQKVNGLSTHHRLLYDIIEEHGEISAGDLHATYEERAQDPRARSSRRRYLHVLENYDLVEKEGATRDAVYRQK